MNSYECVKINKRLWIREIETGELIYTPPDFIKLTSRVPMKELARQLIAASFAGRHRDILVIIEFETNHGPKKKAPEGA